MSEVQVRATKGVYTVIVATSLYHLRGKNAGRRCNRCKSVWTVQRDAQQNFHAWRNGTQEDAAILDWVGNNVAIECCPQ